jgi:hypothetical protein
MPLIIVEEKELLTAQEAKAIAEEWRNERLKNWIAQALTKIALTASKGKMSELICLDTELPDSMSINILKSLGYRVGIGSYNTIRVYWD